MKPRQCDYTAVDIPLSLHTAYLLKYMHTHVKVKGTHVRHETDVGAVL